MVALFAQNGPEGLHRNEEAIRVQQEIGQRNAAARSQVSPEEFDQAWACGERLAARDLIGVWT